MTFDPQSLLENLNPEQQKAVQHGTGPALVLAGAGSGKTTVLTKRAAWLLQSGQANPFSIALVTFTNKAAQEMSHRIAHLTGSQLPFVGTFHKMAVKLLRQHAQMIGIDNNFTIYDTTDQQSLMKSLIAAHNDSGLKLAPGAVLNAVSLAKSELVDYHAYQEQASNTFTKVVGKLFREYQAALKKANAVDFDDLLGHLVVLFRSFPAVLEKYQHQFQFVMVDEYQDTNKAQYELTKMLSLPQANVFVVGDFAQSIYSWRGADYRNMINFKTDFGTVTEYKLEQNYRSHQTILDAATQIISKAQNHPILSLWSEHPAGEKITLTVSETDIQEAEQVVFSIKKERAKRQLKEIAVLYRMNAQSRTIEEALVKQGIPYRLVGGTRFYERAEVKDILAYLRVLTNAQDQVSLDRIIKLGKRKYASFVDWARVRFPDATSMSLLDPHEVLKEILEITQYHKKYSDDTEEDENKRQNIAELLRVSSQFVSVQTFLENIALVQNDTFNDLEAQADPQERVTLMSLHAAKGLEFEVVFMVGMSEGTLPHSRALLELAELEEERRLCYVGITRAKQKLYLSYSTVKYVYGTRQYATPSRFLRDIDQSLVTVVDTSIQNQTNKPWQTNPTVSSGRRFVVDDSLIEDIMHGDMDIDALIDA